MKVKKVKKGVKIWKFLTKHPEAWCKFYFAIDKNCTSVPPDDPKAVQFCARGLIMKFYPSNVSEVEHELQDRLGVCCLGIWNNQQKSVRPVIKAFKNFDL